MLVVGDAGFAEVAEALFPAQKALQREVNIKVYTPAEWADRVAGGSTFLSDVLAHAKIFLIGSQDELDRLGKLAQDRKP